MRGHAKVFHLDTRTCVGIAYLDTHFDKLANDLTSHNPKTCYRLNCGHHSRRTNEHEVRVMAGDSGRIVQCSLILKNFAFSSGERCGSVRKQT